MPQASGYITGIITSLDTGIPLEGVVVSSSGGAACTPSGSDGEYMCADTEGTYVFTYTKAGYVTITKTFTIVGSTSITKNIAMDRRSGTIAGKVTENNRGVRVRGVSIDSNGDIKCTTNPTNDFGNYSCSDCMGNKVFTFAKTGYTTKNVTFNVLEGQTIDGDTQIWRVNPLGNVVGQITDPADGSHPSGVKVTSNAPNDVAVYSDANGNYNYACLEGTWNLTYEKAGYTTRTINGIIVVPSQNTTRDLNLYRV